MDCFWKSVLLTLYIRNPRSDVLEIFRKLKWLIVLMFFSQKVGTGQKSSTKKRVNISRSVH